MTAVRWAMLREVAAVALAFVALVFALHLCTGCSPAANQQGAALAGDACTLITAFGGTPAEQAICATAADVIALESNVRASRMDAGVVAMKAGACKIVGTVCASDAEIARAIAARKVALR